MPTAVNNAFELFDDILFNLKAHMQKTSQDARTHSEFVTKATLGVFKYALITELAHLLYFMPKRTRRRGLFLFSAPPIRRVRPIWNIVFCMSLVSCVTFRSNTFCAPIASRCRCTLAFRSLQKEKEGNGDEKGKMECVLESRVDVGKRATQNAHKSAHERRKHYVCTVTLNNTVGLMSWPPS